MLAKANTGKKIGRCFGKNAGEWTGKVEISKEEIPGNKRSMHVPTPGFKGRTFKLCVLTRWDFNFCLRSFSLRGEASVMILSRNMSKSVGESRHPIRTPTVVRNQSPMLLLKRTTLVALS